MVKKQQKFEEQNKWWVGRGAENEIKRHQAFSCNKGRIIQTQQKTIDDWCIDVHSAAG